MPLNCTSDAFEPQSQKNYKADLMKSTVSFKPGLSIFALFSHESTNGNDLSMTEGDEMQIISLHSDPEWALAVNAKRKNGLVNLSRVASSEIAENLETYPWFHGAISRKDTELRLTPRSINGLFLIRMSNNHPGDLTLSVVCDGQIRHYHIRSLTLGGSAGRRCYSIDDSDGRYYPLSELVRHYALDSDDLCCQLTQPAIAPKSFSPLLTKQKKPQQKQQQQPEFVLHELLGSGEFGEVHKATYRGELVAVKALKVDADPGTMAAFDEEVRLMKTLSHPNLVRYIHSMCLNGKQLLITEYMSLGSLLNYLRSRGQSVISGSDQLRFAMQVAEGMKYLADRCLVHRDLAARNVLLDKSCTAKIADFGLTITCPNNSERCEPQLNTPKQLQSAQTSAADRIPVKWTAPECVTDRSKFSPQSDVWSYGILMWEIYSFGRLPYPRVSTDKFNSQVLSGYRMESPDKCPPDVYRLMRDCWELTPARRPSFSAIIGRLLMISAAVK